MSTLIMGLALMMFSSQALADGFKDLASGARYIAVVVVHSAYAIPKAQPPKGFIADTMGAGLYANDKFYVKVRASIVQPIVNNAKGEIQRDKDVVICSQQSVSVGDEYLALVNDDDGSGCEFATMFPVEPIPNHESDLGVRVTEDKLLLYPKEMSLIRHAVALPDISIDGKVNRQGIVEIKTYAKLKDITALIERYRSKR